MIFVLWVVSFAFAPMLVTMVTRTSSERDILAAIVFALLLTSPVLIAIGSAL